MSNPSLSENLHNTLRFKPESIDVLRNRENSQLEFKETFSLGSRAKYAKTMAAFSNNKGGYIVFGVTNEPHRIKGVNLSNFESFEPSKLTDFLNSHFSPELTWELGTIEFGSFKLGYIYVFESQDKPIIAISNNTDIIQEAHIYYRYRALSSSIKFPELRKILDEKIGRERRAWIQHLTAIGRSGPTNVGIIDTVSGKLFGAGPPFLIDESLLRKLKFIRTGQFKESEGAPTLRLMGDLQPVAGIVVENTTQVGIHAQDLIISFLAQRTIDPAQAIEYLRETIFQTSHYSPLYYYLTKTELSHNQAIELLIETRGANPSTKKQIVKRLKELTRVKPVGTIEHLELPSPLLSREPFMQKLATLTKAKAIRSLILAALIIDPELISSNDERLPFSHLFEAITHMTPTQIEAKKDLILGIMLDIFENHFTMLPSSEKSNFRKAICYCDESVFSTNFIFT